MNNSAGTINIGIVDDHTLIREGLEQILLSGGGDFRITLKARNATEMFNLL